MTSFKLHSHGIRQTGDTQKGRSDEMSEWLNYAHVTVHCYSDVVLFTTN